MKGQPEHRYETVRADAVTVTSDVTIPVTTAATVSGVRIGPLGGNDAEARPPRGPGFSASLGRRQETSHAAGCGWSIRGLPPIGTPKNTTPSFTVPDVSLRPMWTLDGSSTNASPGPYV